MKYKLTALELKNFCGQMGMLLHSGISTTEGLHILCDESKTDADRQILTPLIRSVEENGSLSRALDESGIFPTSMPAYVRTGEETGCLDEIMESLNIIEQLIDNIPEGPYQEKMKPIIRVPEANLNVVRAGITIYGIYPSEEVERDIVKLIPAMELKSHVSYVKNVERGTAVSYGGTFITERFTRMATIPVGYADGYPRQLSKKGWVLIHGKKAPILGRVCMDQFMVDVTDIPEVKAGDEVTLMG